MVTKPKTVCSHPTCSALTSGRYCATHASYYQRQEAARLRSKAAQRSSSVRRAVDVRDQRRCVICGSPYGVQKHHRKPLAEGGADVEENIITLCDAHHKAAHRALAANR